MTGKTMVTTVQMRLLIAALDDDRVVGQRAVVVQTDDVVVGLSPSQSVRLNHSDDMAG